MSAGLQSATWPEASLGEGLWQAARRAGLQPCASAAESGGSAQLRGRRLEAFIEALAQRTGIEAQPVSCESVELTRVLSRLGSGLLRCELAGERRYLLVLRSGPRGLRVLTPRLRDVHVPHARVCELLCAGAERNPLAQLEQWLGHAGLSQRQVRRARRPLLAALEASQPLSGMWLLRADPGSSFMQQLRRQAVLRRLVLACLLTLAQVASVTVGWGLLAQAALSGRFEQAWMQAFALALLSSVPLSVGSAWLGHRLLDDGSLLLKRRLLCGALRLDPDHVQRRGSGRLLAMVTEAETLAGVGLSGVFELALALLQLVSALVVLAFGAGGLWHSALLAAWTLLVAWLAVKHARERERWTSRRFDLAHGFVEQVLGHRTRAVQRTAAQWHGAEDRMLSDYLQRSAALDRAQALLSALPARGWLALSLLGLVPALLADASPTGLALAIGGCLQAQAAFAAIAISAAPVAAAWVAWRQLRELHRAAAELPAPGFVTRHEALSPSAVDASPPRRVLELRGVSFRYPSAAEPVLRECQLTLHERERVLLQGASGGGKSTLSALLVGRRAPQSGHILLRGLDRATLGSVAWRARVAAAPQFHENHVLSGTLAFNLLLGRGWPPSRADLVEAEALCRELELGPMLDRMPSGVHQVIGETGWQLSHGERSRIFLARALLQAADLVILDESFGALDPLTLRACMSVVRRRANSLIVIAHV